MYKLKLLGEIVYRALIPCKDLQTGASICGPASTAKSTFVNWLSSVLQEWSLETICARDSGFDRANLVQKRFIVLSDGDRIIDNTARLIKRLCGRDPIG